MHKKNIIIFNLSASTKQERPQTLATHRNFKCCSLLESVFAAAVLCMPTMLFLVRHGNCEQ